MANLRLSLTDAICKRARPEMREYALHDLRLPGLSLRVQPSGARSWTMRLRMDGTQARRSLGSFPETNVRSARQLANALMAGDADMPRPTSAAPLFAAFQAEHEAKCGPFYKPSGLRTYRSYVRNQLLPAFAGKRIDAITRQDIVCWFERYSAKRPGGASRALGILGQILASAKAWGHLPRDWHNPVSGIRMNRRRIVGTFLSAEQMARLGTVLDACMREGCAAAALLRFLTLTGCRVSEAVHLEWRDVLPDRLRLRDSKTGPRDVPIGMPVRRFLKLHRASLAPPARVSAGPVFPLTGGQRYEPARSTWIAIRREADLPPTLRIHDLRHSFASHAVMSGETLLSASRLLGHRRVQTTARYAHLADTTLLDTTEKIGELIMSQVRSA